VGRREYKSCVVYILSVPYFEIYELCGLCLVRSIIFNISIIFLCEGR
jgi:hypothetical protein